MVKALEQKFFFGVLFALYWLVITWVRMQRLVITELLQLNTMLEGNQRQHDTIKEMKEEDAVVFPNGGAESLSILARDTGRRLSMPNMRMR